MTKKKEMLDVIDILMAVFVGIRNRYYSTSLHKFIYSKFVRKPKFRIGQEVYYTYGSIDGTFVQGNIINIEIRGKEYYYSLDTFNKKSSYPIHENRIELTIYENRNNIIDNILD